MKPSRYRVRHPALISEVQLIPTYRLVRRTRAESLGGIRVLRIETQFSGRIHTRIVGADKFHHLTYGRTILYFDSYKQGSVGHIYARHSVDAETFLADFDVEASEWAHAGLTELSGQQFPVIRNQGGTFFKGFQSVPLRSEWDRSDLKFFRIDMPFGSLSIEFGKPVIPEENEAQLATSGEMIRALQSPLVACETSKGEQFLSLFSRIHWAAESLGEAALREYIDQEICEGAVA